MVRVISLGIQPQAPLYKEIKRQLMQSLSSGEWQPGDAIPAEAKLADRFGVSIGTVRKAIDDLVADKILIRQQGRGTFVAVHDPSRLMVYFFHVRHRDGRKEYPDVETVAFAHGKADQRAARALGVPPATPTIEIENVLRFRGQPVIFDRITLRQSQFTALSEERFRARPGTIYQLYQSEFGVSVVRTQDKLRAVLADAHAASRLSLARRAPLLEITRVAYTYHDQPVELRVSLVDTTDFEYIHEAEDGVRTL